MLQQILSAVLGAIVSGVAGALKDMRGEATLRQVGAQDVYLRQQEVANEVRKRAAAIDRRPVPRDDAAILGRL